ncbi:MAG: hypothetical protein EP350_10280 [Alphaproteobacteria bacterium]|nr:MAG: hypothetical protein EP350_10280 [Alphaproteobacteria bacterium]
MRSQALAALCLGFMSPSAHAASTVAPIMAQYQEREQRLQDIGWRLVHGNARFCTETRLSIGLTLQDMAGFGSPDAARAALGLSRDFAVQSAAAGSPSALAGLSANLEVRSIAGTDPNRWPAEERRDWRRLTRAHDLIDAELAKIGAVELALEGPQSTLAVRGEMICATRFELASNSKDAKAEGARVIIGETFIGFTYQDEELAAAIAHELAHNLLRHRAWLDANGRKRKDIRLTEREADRLMPWLLANAGYDPAAASRFMQQWGPGHDRGIFRARTHDGWDERLEAISAEVALVEDQMRDSGAADWKQRFRREISD